MIVGDVVGLGTVAPAPGPVLAPAHPVFGDATWAAYRLAEPPGRPDYPVRRLRRLGRAQSMALSAVKRALDASIVEIVPEDRVCVCVGTGWAEIGDEVVFLARMIEEGEKGARPMKFANSVHNALASQLAMEFGWNAENHTFTHGALSFESALTQASLLFRTGRTQRAVVCGVDSMAEFLEVRGHQLGLYSADTRPLSPLDPAAAREGTIPGEGGAALVLAAPDTARSRLARIAGVRSLGATRRDDISGLRAFVGESLEDFGLTTGDLDLVLLGANGDRTLEAEFTDALDGLPGPAVAVYRHRTGDFDTAAALGTALAVSAVHSGVVPDEVRVVRGVVEGPIRRVLLVHLAATGHRSVILVTP